MGNSKDMDYGCKRLPVPTANPKKLLNLSRCRLLLRLRLPRSWPPSCELRHTSSQQPATLRAPVRDPARHATSSCGQASAESLAWGPSWRSPTQRPRSAPTFLNDSTSVPTTSGPLLPSSVEAWPCGSPERPTPVLTAGVKLVEAAPLAPKAAVGTLRPCSLRSLYSSVRRSCATWRHKQSDERGSNFAFRIAYHPKWGSVFA